MEKVEEEVNRFRWSVGIKYYVSDIFDNLVFSPTHFLPSSHFLNSRFHLLSHPSYFKNLNSLNLDFGGGGGKEKKEKYFDGKKSISKKKEEEEKSDFFPVKLTLLFLWGWSSLILKDSSRDHLFSPSSFFLFQSFPLPLFLCQILHSLP